MHIFTFQNNLGRLLKYAWIENAKVGDQHQKMFAYFPYLIYVQDYLFL